MSKGLLVLACGLGILLANPPATAQGPFGWWDDFESYPPGGIHGKGGWRGWDGNPAFDAQVTTQTAYEGRQSLLIMPQSDIVQSYTGYTSGRWIYHTELFIPGNMRGKPYFVMLTDYREGGPYHWTVQLQFDAEKGVVHDDFTGKELPLVRDQWAELVVIIDLDGDQKVIWYDGQPLASATWTCQGCNNQPKGRLNIAAVDLFGNDASGLFFDPAALGRLSNCVGSGDANCDGVVNNFDIDAFVLALTNPEEWNLRYGASCDMRCATDMNGDGAVNNFDIDDFVYRLVHQEPKQKYCEAEITHDPLKSKKCVKCPVKKGDKVKSPVKCTKPEDCKKDDEFVVTYQCTDDKGNPIDAFCTTIAALTGVCDP